jgi:hypothetical protein
MNRPWPVDNGAFPLASRRLEERDFEGQMLRIQW